MPRPLPTVAEALARLDDNEMAHERDCEVLGDEVRRLQAELDRLTPRWQEGEPPTPSSAGLSDAEQVVVWREGRERPVLTYRLASDDTLVFLNSLGQWQPWGIARWAPIPRPT